MRVYEAIGETLKKLEVQATFGLMGDGNLRFMTHLAQSWLALLRCAPRRRSGGDGGWLCASDWKGRRLQRDAGTGRHQYGHGVDRGAQSQHSYVTSCG